MTPALVGKDKHNINCNAWKRSEFLGYSPSFSVSEAIRLGKYPACYCPRDEYALPRDEYLPAFSSIGVDIVFIY